MPAETRGRVLVVDDEPDAALTLTTLLSLGGYSPRACHDGTTALALAEKLRPTACVLDIMMPGMDGYELARRLRGLLGPQVMLIAVTGRSGDEYARQAVLAGFDWFFTKPADPDELLIALAASEDQTAEEPPFPSG